MAKDVGDAIGAAIGHAAREVVDTVSANAKKGSKKAPQLSGGKGMAAGAGVWSTNLSAGRAERQSGRAHAPRPTVGTTSVSCPPADGRAERMRSRTWLIRSSRTPSARGFSMQGWVSANNRNAQDVRC